MSLNKQTLIVAFALFSLFFGAGNLILPPFLGYNAGTSWPLVSIGFAISAVIIPIMAIYGHARLQGTLMDFAKKVSPLFALIYSLIIYAISVTLPSSRTASVTYEMAIEPYFEMSSLTLSAIYFALVLVFALNRTRILSLIGKFLTPFIIVILLIIISIGLFADVTPMSDTIFKSTFTDGILEGYQTFDAIAGVVVGGVIVVSLALQGTLNYDEKKKMIAKAGLLSGIGLIVIYGGLIALGATYNTTIVTEDRVQLLTDLSKSTLGNIGTSFLGVLVALACFTTAVGIITGTADFAKKIAGNSQVAYVVTAVVSCIIGVVVGQFDVHYIIDIALPALMFIYPITIALIILNVLPQKLASPLVFKLVILVTFLFSIPDFLQFFTTSEMVDVIKTYIPFAGVSMGWVLPALFAFVVGNLIGFRQRN